MIENTLLYWVWLAGALGPGGVHVRDVLDTFGTPQALYEARFSQDLSALLHRGSCMQCKAHSPKALRACWRAAGSLACASPRGTTRLTPRRCA